MIPMRTSAHDMDGPSSRMSLADRWTSWRRGALPLHLSICAVLSGACGFDRPQAPSEALPVIQGTLVAGADSQFFRLDWASSPDSVWNATPDPISAGLVALTVSGAGVSQPLVLRPGGFGVFAVTLPIFPDTTYTLSGTIDGTAVSATTTIPGPLSGTQPAGDTIVITAATDCTFLCQIPFDLRSPGSAEIRFGAFDAGGAPRWSGQIDPDSAVLHVSGDPQIASIVITAVDLNFFAYTGTATARSSITGGFGLFGSAVRTTKAVRWQ